MPREKDQANRCSEKETIKETLEDALTVHYAGKSQYETLAITESAKQEKHSGVPLPSKQNIKEAKDWVDENEK